MQRILLIIISVVVFLLIVLFGNLYVVNAETSENDTMTVEVDLVDFTTPLEFVGVQIPDHVYIGNLSKKDMVSEEIGIYINNTGNVDITVTPELKDSNEKIFSYLYFRFQKTVNKTDVKQERIGNWSLAIEKPDEGDDYKRAHFYMQLNLKDYPEEIKQDIMGHTAEIVFYAMPQ